MFETYELLLIIGFFMSVFIAIITSLFTLLYKHTNFTNRQPDNVAFLTVGLLIVTPPIIFFFTTQTLPSTLLFYFLITLSAAYLFSTGTYYYTRFIFNRSDFNRTTPITTWVGATLFLSIVFFIPNSLTTESITQLSKTGFHLFIVLFIAIFAVLLPSLLFIQSETPKSKPT